jgi:hypothetical protein
LHDRRQVYPYPANFRGICLPEGGKLGHKVLGRQQLLPDFVELFFKGCARPSFLFGSLAGPKRPSKVGQAATDGR